MKQGSNYMHITFATKRRKKMLDEFWREFIAEAIKNTCFKYEWDLIGIAIEIDHVHLLMELDLNIAVEYQVSRIKSESAGKLARFLDIGGMKLWQRSFFVEVASMKQLEAVEKYINHHEFAKTFLDDLEF